MTHRLASLAARTALAAAVLTVAAYSARAQDTTPPRGVRIGLTYDAGAKPAVAVGTVRGPWGDTVRAIIMRDLENGDRVEVVGAPGTPSEAAITQIGTGVNYVVWKALAVAAALQMSLLPTGLHVAAHNVAQRSVLQAHDFPVTGAPGSAEWRLAVHAAADEVERWLTGTRGIAASRILFVRGGRVYLVDSDGWGERALTESGISLSPAWHPLGEGHRLQHREPARVAHHAARRERRPGASAGHDTAGAEHDAGLLRRRRPRVRARR